MVPMWGVDHILHQYIQHIFKTQPGEKLQNIMESVSDFWKCVLRGCICKPKNIDVKNFNDIDGRFKSMILLLQSLGVDREE